MLQKTDVISGTVKLNTSRLRQRFRRQLLEWYREHRRPLPWREASDPYAIWVSEIMLQQTRVAVVLSYYERFLKSFPTIRDLALAQEPKVLASWSGLGYYRRARMLHRGAQAVAAEHRGSLPRLSSELQLLPGIGRYTANAIASIAFGEPVAVVDGNVERVLERVTGSSFVGGTVWSAAQDLLDPEQPGDFNQAMMELGATVCVPGLPLCSDCPVKGMCASRGVKPEISKTTERRLRKSANLVLLRRGQTVGLSRRAGNERLMPGMWELPQVRRKSSAEPLLSVRHSITNTDWSVSVFKTNRIPVDHRIHWISLSQVSRLPLTGLTRKILRKLNLLA